MGVMGTPVTIFNPTISPYVPHFPPSAPHFKHRLVTDEDRVWVGTQVAELNEKHFKEKISRVLGTDKTDDASLINALRGLMFGDFMVPGADPKLYVDIKDQTHMQKVITEYLSDFNATSKKPMHLVLFQV